MPMRYPGGVISATPPTVSTTTAKGVWTLEEAMQYVKAGNWPSVSGYQIQRSLRFNPGDTPYLSRTYGSTTDRQKWTWSGWVKRVATGTVQNLMFVNNGSAGTPRGGIGFLSGDTFTVSFNTGGSSWDVDLVTTQVFRDVSAWYHIVVAVDTTQATSSNRIKLYVNGSQVTAFSTSTYPAQNTNTPFNTTYTYILGATDTTQGMLNGYLTEVYYIDGQQLTPSSFGETNANTGVWQPKQVTGMTYGTNGFYVNFSDNSGTTSTTLGKDYSGNGNNWTPNNFSVTAGAGNDSLVDTPTPYGTDTGAGGEVRGNYSTWNPLNANVPSPTSGSVTNGSLDCAFTNSTTASQQIHGTIAVSSGKWYFEVLVGTITGAGGGKPLIGVAKYTADVATYNFSNGVAWSYYGYNGNKYNSSSAAYGNSFTTNDIVGVAIDMDNGKIWFSKNGTWQASGDPAAGTNAAFTNLAGNMVTPCVQDDRSNDSKNVTLNCGQRAFAYTAPTGFKALCTQNLPTPTIGATSTTLADDYFNTVLYTGNGSTNSISSVGFQPDFVWLKDRTSAYNHELFDAVRGALKYLSSSTTNAESTLANSLTAFNSDGFSLGSDIGGNTNGNSYVAWAWNAGGSNATNTNGTISSTVRANTTAGISVVTYTGNGTDGATVGHGLGKSPGMVIVKNRSDAHGWMVAHSSLSSGYNMSLDGTGAQANTYSRGMVGSYSSTTFTLTAGSAGTSLFNNVNQSGNNYVAYAFAPIAGFSAFGSYTGNGSSDGPFVYLGFRPKFVIFKRSDSTGDWWMFDTSRNLYNVETQGIYANSAAAEANNGATVDYLSNGFKLRIATYQPNTSSGTFIYIAFAENPFKYSLAR